MNVLAIGNSFSQDATRYLHQIAQADGFSLCVVNLYIGGAPLSLHYRNLCEDKKSYSLEYNGESTGFFVSIREALTARPWDVITLQQVSWESPRYETYQPYLNALTAYCRETCPDAKLMLHQTWAYEQGSTRLCEELGYSDQSSMFLDLKSAYEQAAKEIRADGIIPSGEAFQALYQAGLGPFHRDTFHATYGWGRYTLGLVWYEYLTGTSVVDNSFCAFDEPIDAAQIVVAKQTAHQTVLACP